VRAAYLDLDGTLLGAGGNLLADATGGTSDAGVRALALLRAADVPYVFVSGRSRVRTEEAARMLGAAGALGELGALHCGYPVADGQTVHEAIAETGLPQRLLEREAGLEPHPVSTMGREGSHVLRGVASADTAAWVDAESDGLLRLADNGRIGPGETRVFHLLPAAASKAVAVAADIAVRGCDPGTCLSVGDSREDMEIRRAVGTTALVANGRDAEPELEALASFVTSSSHGAGVLEAVERWLG
jgi:hydroxymethylpyrimidine pyrophosphatase-like HAD family hydrolase